MTDPTGLAHAVLLRVAEFIRKLPADQLAELADGTAKLDIVPKGGRPPARTARKAAAPVPAEKVRTDLITIGDLTAAARYLEDLRLTVAQLRGLAKDLDIAVPSKATKAAIQREIVQWTIGRRLDSEAISRPAPG